MKAKPAIAGSSGIYSREALALATLLAVVPSHAAETPAQKEDAAKKNDKKKEGEEVLPDLVVEAERGSVYNPQNVQSQRFTAPLVNTPQSVTVVPKEVYTQQAATSLNDVLRNIPGITFQAGEGGNPTSGDNQFRMRGFDASNSIFVDGVRDGGQQDRDIFNIEQVEVARGPAGTDVGRTTAAGYINLTTKLPQLEQFVRGTTSYAFDETDADGNFRQTVDYNQPLNLYAQGGAFRVNGLYQEGGVTGREIAESNRWSLAPSFALGLGTDSRYFLTFQYTEINNLPDYGLPRAALSSGEVGGGSYDPAAPSVEHDTYYGSKYAFEDSTLYNLGFRFEKDISSSLLLTSQTRFSRNDRLAMAVAPTNYTAATGLVTRNFTSNDRVVENFSHITTLRSEFKTGPLEHVLSTGIELIREKADTAAYAGGVAGPVDLRDPDHDLPLTFPTRSGATTASTLDTVSVNVFDTTKISDQWQVTGGLRAEYYELDYKTQLADSATTGTPLDIKTDDFLVDWKLGVVYKPVENGSVYVSYGHSEQNPGTNLNLSASESGTGADNVTADPQESTNYEVGTKWNFLDNKLSTTFALFRTEQENVGTLADEATGEILETGDQIAQGVELGVSGQITENWVVFGAFGYVDTEYKNPTSDTIDGAQLQWTPELSGSVWTTYRLPFGLTVGGGVRYTDETRRSNTTADITNIQGTEAAWVFDALASYTVNDNLTLRFNVNNVFDNDYLRTVNNNGGRFSYGAPRSYVISADWKF